MAKLEMKKIELAALQDDSKKLVELLQRRGAVEICDCRDERLIKLSTSSAASLFERQQAVAKQALETLGEYSDERPALFGALSGRLEIEKHDFGRMAEQYEKTLRLCYRVNENRRRIDEIKAECDRLRMRCETLERWKSLDVPMNFSGTRSTDAFIGTVPEPRGENELSELLTPKDGTPPKVEIISSSKEQTCIFVTCLKSERESVFDLLMGIGFSSESERPSKTPAEETAEHEARIAELNSEREKLCEWISQNTGIQNDVRFVIDYLEMRRDKYKAIEKLGMTRTTFILTGFVPAKYAPKLVDELERKFNVAISLSDPEEEDDVPVLLENNRFVRPVEGVTEMYSLPGKRDVDPNGVMAFFYYLFFGMMLSDAGYGLVMLIVTTVILKKTKVEGALRRSLEMFRNCGVSTVFWGALFGSWFGDIVQVVGREFFGVQIGSLALWFEPIDDPIKLLLVSFGLGIIHLFVGLFVNLVKLWKEGHPFDALCETVPIYITVLGAAPLGASILTTVPQSLLTAGKYLAITGAILVVLTSSRSSKNIFMRFFGGLYGLYNVATGYLSDILSYSRLLALGLATGSIAGVINLIGTMPSNTAVKAVLLTVVFLVGHTANIGINLLGAYVHADRLQFVELFSKFYEGGGRAFEPLCVNTKYIKFKEEEQHV